MKVNLGKIIGGSKKKSMGTNLESAEKRAKYLVRFPEKLGTKKTKTPNAILREDNLIVKWQT